MNPRADDRSTLPAMTRLLEAAEVGTLVAHHGRPNVVRALRAALDEARTDVAAGAAPPTIDSVIARAARALEAADRGGVRSVINATGIVLHTNLGRAPLSERARHAVSEACGPSTVEFDLMTGRRGSRTAHAGGLIARLCETEAATVVNNGAAALVLAVAAIAKGREVIVSRGELIEIGGSFRLPDIIDVSGAHLVEVGTTNRTHLDDYRRAIGPDTALLLSVHRSNFRQAGFVADVPTAELAALAHDHDLPLVHDLGSGRLVDDAEAVDALRDEPVAPQAVRQGADLVLFSGDKLLGGSQAGVIAGRSDLVEACRKHPLARITRIDKLQLAALEATLLAHARGTAAEELPALRLLRTSPDQLHERAARLVARIVEDLGPERSLALEVRATESFVGGGAAPDRSIPGAAIAIRGVDAGALHTALRHQDPPIIARIDDGAVILDLRSVPEVEDPELLTALLRTLAAG